jgi:hypothetical protein
MCGGFCKYKALYESLYMHDVYCSERKGENKKYDNRREKNGREDKHKLPKNKKK